MYTGLITSRANSKYKQWKAWVSNPCSPDCPLVPVEGPRAIQDLLKEGVQPRLVVRSPDRDPPGDGIQGISEEVVSGELMQRLSSTRSSQGVLAFFQKPVWKVDDLKECILYLDRLQDPGNLGTLFRTAAASGLFSIVTSAGTVDCFNDKVVRASASALFRVSFLQRCSLEEVLTNHRVWVAVPRGGQSMMHIDFEPPLIIAIGSEASGVSNRYPDQAALLSIPMSRGTESLNAGVAGSLLIYEVYRRVEGQ